MCVTHNYFYKKINSCTHNIILFLMYSFSIISLDDRLQLLVRYRSYECIYGRRWEGKGDIAITWIQLRSAASFISYGYIIYRSVMSSMASNNKRLLAFKTQEYLFFYVIYCIKNRTRTQFFLNSKT